MLNRIARNAGLALTLAAATASADVVTLSPVKDNTLYEQAAGNLSNGSGTRLFVGRTDEPRNRRALLAFDVGASIPPGSMIIAVDLTLNMSRTQTGNEPVRVHRATADWGEGPSDAGGQEGDGAPSEPGDATWIHTFYDAQRWSTVGGDFMATASATLPVGGNGSYTWASTPALVGDVQAWVDNPMTDFGWILVGNESAAMTAKRFDSREHATPANRPSLRVEFTPGSAAPTVYESTDPTTIVIPANAVGTATASPYDHVPPATRELYYQVDDGNSNPPLIKLVKSTTVPGTLQIHF